MTVAELIAALQKMPMSAEVFVPEIGGGAPAEIFQVRMYPPERWMKEPYVWLE